MPWFQKDDAGRSVPPQPAPASKGVKISPLLSEDVILFPRPGAEKAEVFELLVEAVCRKAGVADPAAVLAKVLEREQGISTTLDTGLSLPHARLDDIDALWAGLAVLRAPLVDPQHPELPIRVVFLFFSPNKREAFPLHLQLLRGVSSLFQSALIEKLAASSGPADALALVRQSDG
jgi:PTS system nitrogen regulatory IIA component